MARSQARPRHPHRAQGLAGGKWRSHLSESALAGIIGRTDRGPGRFLLRWSKRHSAYQPRFPLLPCVMAFFMPSSYWNQVERTEELTLPSLAYDLKQPRILHARIQKLQSSLEKVEGSFLGAKDEQGSIFSYQPWKKQPRVCASAFSFLKLCKESFRFLLYAVLIQ